MGRLLCKHAVFSLLAFGFSATESFAANIYTQLPTAGSLGHSDVDVSAFIADDFTLTSDATVEGLVWRGVYAPASTLGTDNFNVVIFGDAAGQPDTSNILFNGSPVGLTRVDSGLDVLSRDIYQYTANLPISVNLSGSTRYWLSIANDTTADTDDNWFWPAESPGTFGLDAVRNLTTQTSPYPFPVAVSATFALEGTIVAEPTASTLAAFGLAVLFVFGWQRRRRA